MKKLLAIGLMVMSFAASAEWFLVTEGSEGDTRLLAEKGSLKVELNKNKVLVVSGKFGLAKDGVITEIYVLLDATSCVSGLGEMLLVTKSEPDKKVVWARDGRRLYDVAGTLLCGAAAGSKQEKSGTQKNT